MNAVEPAEYDHQWQKLPLYKGGHICVLIDHVDKLTNFATCHGLVSLYRYLCLIYMNTVEPAEYDHP